MALPCTSDTPVLLSGRGTLDIRRHILVPTYSRNLGYQQHCGIWLRGNGIRGISFCGNTLGNGLLSVSAGRACAGTGFRFFHGDRLRGDGTSLVHGITGYGMLHFSLDHGITPNLVQSPPGKKPGESPGKKRVLFGANVAPPESNSLKLPLVATCYVFCKINGDETIRIHGQSILISYSEYTAHVEGILVLHVLVVPTDEILPVLEVLRYITLKHSRHKEYPQQYRIPKYRWSGSIEILRVLTK